MCVFECMQFVSIFPGMSYFNANAQIPNKTHLYSTKMCDLCRGVTVISHLQFTTIPKDPCMVYLPTFG